MNTKELMEMPLAIVCLMLEDRMAREGKTGTEIQVHFKDITFTVSAVSAEVPQTWEEYLKEEYHE